MLKQWRKNTLSSRFIRKYIFYFILLFLFEQAFESSVFLFLFVCLKIMSHFFCRFADEDEVGRMVDKFWSLMYWSVLGEIRNTKTANVIKHKRNTLDSNAFPNKKNKNNENTYLRIKGLSVFFFNFSFLFL